MKGPRTNDLTLSHPVFVAFGGAIALAATCADCSQPVPPESRHQAHPPSETWIQSVPRAPSEGRSPDDRLLFFDVGEEVEGMPMRQGFIDTQGRIVAEPEFAWALSSSEGLAMIGKPGKPGEKGKTGFVDGTGRTAVECIWDEASPFSESLALVATGIEYSRASPFDLVAQSGGKRGYIDRSGAVAIAPRFEKGRAFSEGVAWVREGGRWGLIDRTGKYVLEPKFQADPRCEFSDGLCPVWLAGEFDSDESSNGVGYVDTAGTIVIPARFHAAGSFSEGLAAVEVGGQLGFIDRSGAFVIGPIFKWGPIWRNDWMPVFSSGRAPVRIGKHYGYIDKKGQVVIEPTFDSGALWGGTLKTFDPTLNFSEGLAAVVVDGKTGFIDPQGRMVIAPQFRRVDSFDKGIARVEFERGEWGYLRPDGSLIWPPPMGRWH